MREDDITLGEEFNLVSCLKEVIFNICCSIAPIYLLVLISVIDVVVYVIVSVSS